MNGRRAKVAARAAARHKGVIAANSFVRTASSEELSNDPAFKAAFREGYKAQMSVWGRFYGRQAAANDARLANSELESARDEASGQPGRSQRDAELDAVGAVYAARGPIATRKLLYGSRAL